MGLLPVERGFMRMVEAVSDYAIFLLDNEGVIQTWNPAAVVMKGYREDEAIGRNFSMLYTEEDRRTGHPLHNLRKAAENGTFQEQRWRTRKNGELFWAMVEVIAITDEPTGELVGFCKLTRDITNIRELEQRLRAEKERAEVTLRALSEGVVTLDQHGLIDFINHEAERMTGWSQSEARGRPFEQVCSIVPAGEYNPEESALVDPTNAPMEGSTVVVHTRGGLCRLVDLRKSPFNTADEQDSSCVLVLRDVLEERRMAVALREADRRKDEFLAMLAHELRNPLAPVSSAAELLLLGKLDAPSARKASQVILRQVKHMTELVDDLLDVSRVSRGQITLSVAPIDMKCVVAAAVEQVRPLIESRLHTLVYVVTPAKANVKGDEKRLVQVIANLLSNAAKYTPPGGRIGVDISVTDQEISIAVSDNGVGIPPEIQAVVFELFAQAQRTSDRTSGGLGIGLALVRSLVTMHGGRVSCRSEGAGQGSCFTVHLPRLGHDDSIPNRRSAERQDELPIIRSPLSVLLVDDNVDAAEMVEFFLKAAGHEVVLAHTARAAIAAVKASRPDVCILDIGLPDGSGHDLAIELRRLLAPPPIFIALTGFGMERDRAEAAAAGFDHYLVKPVDLGSLSALLQDVPARDR